MTTTNDSRWSNLEIDNNEQAPTTQVCHGCGQPVSKACGLHCYDNARDAALKAAAAEAQRTLVDAPAAPAMDLTPGVVTPPAAPTRAQAAQAARQAPPVVAPAQTRRTVERSPLIAVEQADESTGAVVYWQMSGDVALSMLALSWAEQGLDAAMLPEVATPQVALHRAVKELAASDVLIRKHPQGGWAIVREIPDQGSLAYVVEARVFLDEAEQLQVVADGSFAGAQEFELATIAPELAGKMASIRAAFGRSRAYLITTDVSSWLVGLASKLKGVPLRERGGIYFFPRDQVATVQKVKAALGSSSFHVVHMIPAMHSADAVAAVFEAISREAMSELDAVDNDLVGDLGARAARTRIDALDALQSKVHSYEALLGRELVDVGPRIASLRSRLEKVTTRAAQLEVD